MTRPDWVPWTIAAAGLVSIAVGLEILRRGFRWIHVEQVTT